MSKMFPELELAGDTEMIPRPAAMLWADQNFNTGAVEAVVLSLAFSAPGSDPIASCDLTIHNPPTWLSKLALRTTPW